MLRKVCLVCRKMIDTQLPQSPEDGTCECTICIDCIVARKRHNARLDIIREGARSCLTSS